ncbi:uncharacterized protein LOC123868479 [Maniola jurtina]|uniref:uncharacterized protein LOC123868479 n=1 Tax=Maniola jurtina TaxID=191418 RepID=UPI001E68F69A|nr:uncharacterized protein LOC123868479 [Maniola jurtina]
MLNEDNKSVIINIPKKRIYSDKLFVSSINKKQNEATRKCRRELSDVELKRYNLPEEVSLPIIKLKQCEIILPFKHYRKQKDKNRFKQSLSISIYDKYKIISTDLQKRLHVDRPLNDIYSVIDVDTEYYSYLGGRALQFGNPVYKSLQESINKILQLKHNTGIKKDCILNIETNYRNELDIYALSVKRLTDQAKYFDTFISEDYEKSMGFLSKWDKVKYQLDWKIKELQNLGIEKFTLQSRLISLEYKYGIQLKYGRFLYYLSPPTWRLNNREFARSVEIEAKGFDYGNSQEDDTFAIIFEKLRKICYGTPIRPVLYFTQPKDLIDVFDAMENQQLHYYTHVNHLTPHTKILKEGIKKLKEVIFQEYAVVTNVIKIYENLLKFSEDRCAQLELKFHKILFGLFYNSIGVPDVLKLISHLEFFNLTKETQLEPADDVRAVVEIQPEFYTVIEGRPLRCFDDIKVYINNIRSYAMNRQQIGYRRDLILKIDQNLATESTEHDKIAANLKQHIKNFQRFLTEDYKRSCIMVSKAEKAYTELVAKNSEFLGYVTELTILNNKLFKLDAIRNVLKTYRSYLIFVAPLSWRQLHDEKLKNKVHSIEFESEEFVTDNDLVETLDIDRMVEVAKQELQNPYPPNMYFNRPEQMLYLFRTMELQSREYLTQLSKTGSPYRLLQDRIKHLKNVTKQELDYFQFYIDSINNEIARESYNENNLQGKFFRILNTTFYNSVASPSTLKLKICIEYVYEQVFGKCEEGHQNLQEPMKILEVMYEDYNLRLDSLDFKIVNQARNDFYAQDLRTMKNAFLAQRELRAFREMTVAMNKAFLPPAQYKRPVLTKFLNSKSRAALAIAERRKSQMDNGERMQPQKYKINQEERDGLLLFTEWCEGMNPAPYLAEYYKFVKPAFEWIPRKSIMP